MRFLVLPSPPSRPPATGPPYGQPDSGQPFAHEGLDGAQAQLLAETTKKVQELGWAVVPGIIPSSEIAAVRESTGGLQEVVVAGRRGPAQASFTIKEHANHNRHAILCMLALLRCWGIHIYT